MSIRNSNVEYGSVSKAFHWLIFFLVLCMFFLGYFMGDVPEEMVRNQAINLHKLTGLVILCLMILRAVWALINPKPIIPNAKVWEKFLAKSGHVLLYLVLIAMPVSGWLMAVAGGRPPHFFNFVITLPVAKNENLKKWCDNTHQILAIVIIVLVSLHVLMALYHHFIKKDNVLQRMSP